VTARALEAVRSAPVSRLTVLAGKTVSMTLVAMMTLLVSFGFALATSPRSARSCL